MPARSTRRAASKGEGGTLVQLWSLGPYDRNQITVSQLDRLRDLIDTLGGPAAAERVGVCEVTLYRVAAGFGHRLRPETAAKVRKFFGGSK